MFIKWPLGFELQRLFQQKKRNFYGILKKCSKYYYSSYLYISVIFVFIDNVPLLLNMRSKVAFFSLLTWSMFNKNQICLVSQKKKVLEQINSCTKSSMSVWQLLLFAKNLPVFSSVSLNNPICEEICCRVKELDKYIDLQPLESINDSYFKQCDIFHFILVYLYFSFCDFWPVNKLIQNALSNALKVSRSTRWISAATPQICLGFNALRDASRLLFSE